MTKSPKFNALKLSAFALLLVLLAGSFQLVSACSKSGVNAGFLQRHVKEKALLSQLGASGVEGSHGLWLLDLNTLNQNHQQITPQTVKQALKPWQRGRVSQKQALGCNPSDEAMLLMPHDKRHQLVLCWSKASQDLAVVVPASATGWVLAPYGLKTGQPISKVGQVFSELQPPQKQNTYWRQNLSSNAELRVYLAPVRSSLAEAVVSHWAVVHF